MKLLFVCSTIFINGSQPIDGVYLYNPECPNEITLLNSGETFCFDKDPFIQITDISSFEVKCTKYGLFAMVISLKSKQFELFKDASLKRNGQTFGILLQGRLLVAPRFNGKMVDNAITIMTSLTEKEIFSIKSYLDSKLR